MRAALRVLLSVLLAAVACAATEPSTPPRKPPPSRPARPPSPPQGPRGETSVTGTERLRWFQEVKDNAPADAFRFAMLVDDERVALPNASCSPVAEGRYLECTTPLPAMSNGRHTLALIVSVKAGSKTLESAPSTRIVVKKVKGDEPEGDSTPGAAGATSAPSSAAAAPAVVIDVISDSLTAVSDLALAPDGRIFVAERRGRVAIADPAGKAGDRTALVLDDVDVSNGLGLFSIALHPEFAKTGYVYLAYTAKTRDGAAYRLVRGRELSGRIGEIAGVREISADGAPAWAVVRFGDDGKLYLTFADARGGKSALFRLNADGSVPDENPGSTPLVLTSPGTPRALLWVRGSMLLVHEEPGGRRELSLLRSPAGGDRRRASWQTDWMIAGAAQPARSKDQLLVARLDGGIQSLEIAVSAERVQATAGARYAREYGAVRAIAAGADGHLYVGTANGDLHTGSAGANDTAAPRDYLLRLGLARRSSW